MRKDIKVQLKAPQYTTITNVTYAQVDAWFGHTTRDLKMDIIYPEDRTTKYPCIVWLCGGGWLSLDKSAHLAYLATLAREGFVVASVQYRTSNDAKFPSQLQDVKAGIRYLRARAERFNIDVERFGVMGESAGGYLSCMVALTEDDCYEAGDYLEYSSKVQAACPWYPPTDFDSFPHGDAESCAASAESLLMGRNVMRFREEFEKYNPVNLVTKEAPPFLILHGTADNTVPIAQSELLHDKLEAAGCDVTMISIEGANHADVNFFQSEIWKEITEFFKEKLSEA